MTPPRPDAAPALAVVDLRCQVPPGVLSIGRDPVRLTWRVAPAVHDLVQESYEIEASGQPEFASVSATTGVVDGPDQIAVRAPGSEPGVASPASSGSGSPALGWTDWSPVLRVEAGLLEAADWQARAITL